MIRDSKKKFIRVCPMCGSDNTTGNTRLIQSFTAISFCKSCGYQGVFPEVEKDKTEEFRIRIKKNQKEK